MKNSRVQEPNVETDHLESSTSGSVNLLNQSFDTIGSNLPGKMSAGPEGMHFFIKWSKTNQMGRCVQRTKGRHMCPVPAMEATENVVTVPLTPHPSSTSKMGEHSHLRAYAPPFYPWYGGAMWLQSSQI